MPTVKAPTNWQHSINAGSLAASNARRPRSCGRAHLPTIATPLRRCHLMLVLLTHEQAQDLQHVCRYCWEDVMIRPHHSKLSEARSTARLCPFSRSLVNQSKQHTQCTMQFSIGSVLDRIRDSFRRMVRAREHRSNLSSCDLRCQYIRFEQIAYSSKVSSRRICS